MSGSRAHALQALAEVTRAVNEAGSAKQAVSSALRILVEGGGWEAGHLWLLPGWGEGAVVSSGEWHVTAGADYAALQTATEEELLSRSDGFAGTALGLPGALHVDDAARFDDPRAEIAAAMGLRSIVGCAVRGGGRALALLECFAREPSDDEPLFLEILPDACAQIGRAVERHDLQRRITTVADRERQSLAQEIHDSLGQQLSALGMMATTLSRSARGGGAVDADALERLARGLDDVKREVRGLTRQLLPVEVESGGLMRALDDLAHTTDLAYPETTIRFVCERPTRLDDSFTATQLYRIAQEALTNALRHGSPRRVTLRLEPGDPLRLSVEDDGSGFDGTDSVGSGSGLRIMHHRAGLVGGTLQIDRADGGGTIVRCLVPASRAHKKMPGSRPA